MIINISESTKPNKRFCLTMDNGKKYNFGHKYGQTFIDHHEDKKRENYWKRHLANKTEKELIKNLTPSPALFSAVLLWGQSTNINKNIQWLNHAWKIKDTQR